MKVWTRSEIKFRIACILVRHLSFKLAADLARLIYADIVSPAVEEERKTWEELNHAKDNGNFN